MSEVKCYTVAVGTISMSPFKMHKCKEALKYITTLEGFVGIHPRPEGTLCLFTSENSAKGARNMMRAKGIQTGKNICEVFVDERYIKENNNG